MEFWPVKLRLHGGLGLECDVPDTPATPPHPGSPALPAFLRGIERRAWVFALAQCGDPALAEPALAATLRAFADEAPREPLAQWPFRFWTLLMRQPQLLEAGQGGDLLAQLTPGPRAALLLRLVAGLDFAHAAQVLGVREPAYRHALSRVLEQASPADLRQWRETLQARVRDLPDERIAALAQWRAQALSARDEPSPRPTPVAPPTAPVRGRRTGLAVFALVVLALAFVATYLWPLGPRLAPGQSEALPTEVVPVSPALDDATVVTHPDYLQIARPQDETIARDLGLLSWIGAGSPGVVDEAPLSTLEEAQELESSAPDADAEGGP